jgi:hypothetical protein
MDDRKGDKKMSKMKSLHLLPTPWNIFIALVLLTALSLGMVTHSPRAYAGSNGQQVKVCGLGAALEYGKVVGPDQRGVQKTWIGVSDGFLSGSITTYGSWWIGRISVYESYTWNPAQFVYVGSWNVPKYYSSDIYQINC